MTDEIKDFIESESVQISKIDDFEKFTLMASAHLEKLEYKVVKYVIEHLECKENQTAWTYYRLLRILPLILKDEPSNLIKIPSYYFDEQLVKLAYSTVPESVNYMSNTETKIYLSQKLHFKFTRYCIKSFNMFKAML